MTDFVIVERNAAETDKYEEFEIRLPNEALSLGESVARVGNVWANVGMTRRAVLRMYDHFFELGCINDFASYEFIRRFPISSISRVRCWENALSRRKQLLRPALSGAFLGLGICGVVIYQTWGERTISMLAAAGLCLAMIFGWATVFVLISFFRNPGSLSVIDIDLSDGPNVGLSIENTRLTRLLSALQQKRIVVESLGEEGGTKTTE